jgi:hypothetical protein
MFFATITRKNLPVYGVRQKSLCQYQKQEKDVAKGINLIPLPLARLVKEDLFEVTRDSVLI